MELLHHARRTRRRSFVAVLLALTLVAAACGSSDDEDDEDTEVGETTEETSAPAKGTPLRIGWIGTETSAQGAASKQGSDTMDAWIKQTNASGGVEGHPVEAFFADDKGDPAVGLAAVKDLVENKKVIAIVGSSAGTTQQTWAPYVLEKRIPVVNGSRIDALWFSNPMFFPIGGTVITNIWGQMKAASVAGAKKVAVILCTEVAACAQAQGLFKSMAEANGLEVAYNALASQSQASYTAECLAAKNAGAEAVAAFVNGVVFARDCSRQGFKPIWINSSSGPTAATIKSAPELGNTAGSAGSWLCLDPKVTGTDELYAALKKHHPDWAPGGKQFDQAADAICGAWVGGKAFAKAIANAGVTANATVTSDDVIKGLSMFKEETLGGLAPKITLSDGTKPNPQQKCVFLYKWKGTKLSAVPKPDELTCQP